jgi:CRISPR-associated endonuclease Cas2
MGKAKKELTFTSKLLLWYLAMEDVMSPVFSPYELRRRLQYENYGSYKTTLYRWHKRGWIKFVDKNAQRFIKLTKKGELEALLAKAILPPRKIWDNKWRLFSFDIPEECKEKRRVLRYLLKKNGYKMLQASVYISPYPLNREAIEFLKRSGLKQYIRIMKIEEMDDDSDLKKKFSLK